MPEIGIKDVCHHAVGTGKCLSYILKEDCWLCLVFEYLVSFPAVKMRKSRAFSFLPCCNNTSQWFFYRHLSILSVFSLKVGCYFAILGHLIL